MNVRDDVRLDALVCHRLQPVDGLLPFFLAARGAGVVAAAAGMHGFMGLATLPGLRARVDDAVERHDVGLDAVLLHRP